MTKLPEKYVITIGRRMGSGGRQIGRMLADRLGIAFYDKELLSEAAERSGLNPEFFERNDERRPHFISGLFPFSMALNPMSTFAGASSVCDDALYKAQCDFMHEIADAGPCVIVGRSADYVLRDVDNVVNIFIHADIDDCTRRIADREGVDTDSARHIAEKTDKLRAGFYNFYTDKRWGDTASYDLAFNTSKLDLDSIVDLIIAYLHARLVD